MKLSVKSENGRMITPMLDLIQNILCVSTVITFFISLVGIFQHWVVPTIICVITCGGCLLGLLELLDRRYFIFTNVKISLNLYKNYKAVRKALFHCGIYNKFESRGKEPKLLAEVPEVSFIIRDNGLPSLVIANYASYNNGLENVNLDSVLSGWIVGRMYISDDGLNAVYELLDEAMEQPIINNKQEMADWFNEHKLKNGKPCFVFDNNTTREFFSLGVFGRSGSGKSTLIKTLIAEMQLQNFEIEILDPKDSDLAVLANLLGYKYGTTPEDAINIIEDYTKELNERQEMMFQRMKQDRKTGITPFDIGCRPKMLIIDELGALMAAMPNSKDKPYKTIFINDIKQLIFKARQLSMGVMIITQQYNAQLLGGSAVKEQLMLVQLGRNDVQSDMTVFGHKTPPRNMPLGAGYVKASTDITEQFVWTPWLRYELV